MRRSRRPSATTRSPRLASRPAWALALLDAVRKGSVPRRDLNTTVARQILAFDVPNLNATLAQAWGTLRPTARDKAPLIARYKTMLASRDLPTPDPDRGRALFGRICAQCHRLFDQGGDVGPDLTGSDRANPDYILENVLDPSATVGRDYTVTTVATRDGRLVSGHPPRADAGRPGDPDPLRADHLAARRRRGDQDSSTSSMMPEGQLDPLTPQEIRDLFAYLAATRPAARSQ